jgi:hypothetical protein
MTVPPFSVIPPHTSALCQTCLDTGFIEVDDCTCGAGDHRRWSEHEPTCGWEPCPEGCAECLT